MTANLEVMMKFRDLQVAEDFAKMAELGYMDKEFAVYGCAYVKDGVRCYLISSESGSICDFIAACGKKQLYPTRMQMLQKICPVPLGQEEAIALDLKRQLAFTLQGLYPEAFFEQLERFAKEPNRDTAYALLKAQQEQLEGVYDRGRLQCYGALVELAFAGKVLGAAHYAELMAWLDKIYGQMLEDVAAADVFTKCFYAIAYCDANGQALEWYADAQREQVLRRRQALMDAQMMVSPVFEDAVGYNYTYRLSDARRDFMAKVRGLLDGDYMLLVRQINAMPPAVAADALQREVARLADAGYGEAAQTLAMYGRSWHIS